MNFASPLSYVSANRVQKAKKMVDDLDEMEQEEELSSVEEVDSDELQEVLSE